MEALDAMFFFLKICGFWQPSTWMSQWAILIYNGYGLCIWFLIIALTFSMVMDAILTARSIDEFAENGFVMLSFVNACCKVTNVMIKRRALVDITKQLSTEPFIPSNDDEKDIKVKCDREIKTGIFYYSVLLYIVTTVMSIFMLIKAFTGTLLSRAWQPYNISNPVLFWLTYAHHNAAMISGATMQIATDILVFSMMLQICAQLKILKIRFTNVTRILEEKENPRQYWKLKSINRYQNIAECVNHHLTIIKFAKKVNNIFSMVIFIQFSVISFVICCIMYLISMTKIMSVKFLLLITYASSMLCQIFLYCWFGNEVILESIDVGNSIYQLNLTGINARDVQDYFILMLRCNTPIEFTSSFLITLSLKSFTSILKISYSAFNLLQQVSS